MVALTEHALSYQIPLSGRLASDNLRISYGVTVNFKPLRPTCENMCHMVSRFAKPQESIKNG